jgi:hypothetical protein
MTHWLRCSSWDQPRWAGLFAVRVAIQLPFYLMRDVPALTIATLLLGLPLFAPLAVHTWRNIRSILSNKAVSAVMGS